MSIIKRVFLTGRQCHKGRDIMKLAILTLMVLFCMGASYYAHFVAHIDVVYPDLFYVPIVMAGFWWGKRGIWVATFLGGWLVSCHVLSGLDIPYTQDVLRAGMFIVVSVVVGTLREQGLKTEQWLQKSEEQLRGVLDASDEIIFVKDLKGRYTLVNAALSEKSKWPLEEVLGKTDAELFSKEEAEMLKEIDRKVLETGEPDSRENILTVGGEKFIFKTTKVPLRNGAGKIVGLCGFANDITERKKAEGTLRESEARFRAVAETATDAIITIDGHDRIIFWNQAAADIFGYSTEEMIGKPLTLLMPERFRNAHQKAIKRVLSAKESHITGKTVEMVGLRKDGSEFPVEFSSAVWETDKGMFFTSILRDITERKKKDALLRESEARYRLLFEKIADAVFITSFEGEILEANLAASEQTGYSHEELIGMNIMEDLTVKEPAVTYDEAKENS